MNAETVHVQGDKTIYGVGGVDLYDGEGQRTIRGDQVTYNPDTGYSRVEGSGYVSAPDGSLTAPLIEGNAREIRFTATGGVQFESDVHQLSGSGDQAVYTKSPMQRTERSCSPAMPMRCRTAMPSAGRSSFLNWRIISFRPRGAVR